VSDATHSHGDLSDFTVAIFSFNRGGYLENCARSCLAHMPGARVVIYDDDSDDQDTLRVLEQLEADGCVIHRVTPHDASSRHGGLYGNMQLALENCETPIILFLQDDTQVVRTLDAGTANAIRTAFSHPDIAFVRPQFFKHLDMWRFGPHFHPKHVGGLIEPNQAYKDCNIDHAYCDVVLGDVELLRRSKWRFTAPERANQDAAKRLFKFMPYLVQPFVFYCPEVPSYRDRKLYLASRIVQSKRDNAVVRLNDMGADMVAKLFALKDAELPIAEDFLTASHTDVRFPFVFQDYARSRRLHVLYKVESRLYRIWSGLLRKLRLKK